MCCFRDGETEAQHGCRTNLHQGSGTSCSTAQGRSWVERVPNDVKLGSQVPRSFALLFFFCFPPVFFPLISSNGSFTESEIPRAMSSWSGWRAADPGTRGRATAGHSDPPCPTHTGMFAPAWGHAAARPHGAEPHLEAPSPRGLCRHASHPRLAADGFSQLHPQAADLQPLHRHSLSN